ncbi:MAG: helix-turn-helix transcriptional regulator [Eubacterium sp.]|nr:helix-turn-helix transcriptional regulator [Eubacterium sp.]
MHTEQFETMVSMCRYLGIQILLFDESYNGIEQIDYGFRKKMLQGFDYQRIQNELEHYVEPAVFYLYEDDMGMHYSLLRFTKEDAADAGCQAFCIGPILYQPLTRRFALELVERLNVPSRYEQDFIEYFNCIPVVPYYDLWYQLLTFFIKRCQITVNGLRQINPDTVRIHPSSDYHYLVPDMPDVALTTIEKRYQWENAMLEAVTAGNTQKALDAHYQFLQFKLLPRAADPVRDRKNIMFTFNTLLRKAVEAAKVHPLHIDNLSRQFAIQIETALSTDQLQSLSTTMIRKYCMLVNNYSRRSYSSLVQTCMDYVDFHYSSELSLAGLAKMCFVTPSYLSSQFKKEAGITITDYINSTRIRQSMLFLNVSKLSVGEIASRVGFSDANYFTRTFKKMLGKTPKAYRQAIHE